MKNIDPPTIIEGKFVHPDGVRRHQVKIGRGIIEGCAPSFGQPDMVLNDDALIFPAFIDIHVHAREDSTRKQNYKEDFASASMAAINGGVASIMDMPNNPVPPVDERSYSAKLDICKHSFVPVVLYAGIGPDTHPIARHDIPYKCFMGPSIGPLFFSSKNELDSALSRYKGMSVSFHCEDPEILKEHENERTHPKRRPSEAEVKAIETAIKLSNKYNLDATICHVSTRRGMELCIEAGVKTEVTPHHLYFADEEGILLQTNPPIRSPEDRDFLLENLDKFTYLASDHAPHTEKEKLTGTSGVTGLDTFGLFVSWLIKEKGVLPQTVLKLASTNPGDFFGRYNGKKWGKIETGYQAVFTIMDFGKKTEVTLDFLKTKNRWSPFIGKTFPSEVRLLSLLSSPNALVGDPLES